MAEHGTRSTYVHDECRCPPCTDSNRLYHLEYRRARVRFAEVDAPAACEAPGRDVEPKETDA